MVQGLGLGAKGLGTMSGQGTKIPQAAQCGQKKTQNKTKNQLFQPLWMHNSLLYIYIYIYIYIA